MQHYSSPARLESRPMVAVAARAPLLLWQCLALLKARLLKARLLKASVECFRQQQ